MRDITDCPGKRKEPGGFQKIAEKSLMDQLTDLVRPTIPTN